MATISEFKEFFGEWIAAVAGAVDVVADRVMRPRRILLLEGDDGAFTATTAPTKNGPALPDLSFRLDQGRPHPPLPADWEAAFRGSRVEAQLQSDHVIMCPLDFPSQAGEFLDGMIRAQIDRLTPWTAVDVGIRLELAHGGRERPDRSDVRRDVEASGRAVAPVRPCAGCRLGRDLRCGRRPARPPGSSCSTSRCEALSVRQRTCRACCARFCSRPVLRRRPRF